MYLYNLAQRRNEKHQLKFLLLSIFHSALLSPSMQLVYFLRMELIAFLMERTLCSLEEAEKKPEHSLDRRY